MVNILIGLVVAMFIICAAYVGYNVSQDTSESIEGHNINIELDILDMNTELLQIVEKQDGYKSII
ncbi:MAG: hypothetical protein HOE93_00905 [Nitrosopumilus sp.]|jgi:CHASE3 domain sensor protein|nr:hypothetical protein [Nitrosopumilus sp.]MBT3573761.1 hypothetical protein [Nitrosopumilus sp.]MBT3861970.1 hypothetical protein [Nitrosopumilus sp.]MBT3955862.1 hypothetical protein [Nitrosopumilus sp.]MBT4299083.1 hypothetical protein [Nitrosopumilus sp.]